MFVEVFDDDAPAAVWLFCGTENGADDHQRWMRSMQRTDAVAGRRGGAAILIIDDGNPPPSPADREALTRVARGITGTTPLAVVTSSAIARSVIAALSFTRVVAFPVKGFVDVAGAAVWLAGQTRVSAAHLSSLVDEARARSAQLTVSATRR